MVALLQQVVSHHQHTPGDDIARDWLQKLFERGRLLLRHLQPERDISDFDILLQIFNLFNLCTSYFSAASLLGKVSGQDALSRENLDKQKVILRGMAASLQ